MSLRSIVRDVKDGICGTLNPKSESQEALLEKHYQDLTFSTSVKHCELGPKDETIKCFIKRDKSNNTYRLFLSLSSSLLDENGEFLLSAKRTRGVTYTEYAISMDPDNTSRSIIGTMRSNILGSKFTIYDSTLACNNSPILPRPYPNHRLSKKVSTKYKIANVTYECNVFGTRGPRKMHCIMHSNVPLVMINKSPRWHGKLKGWCLNFKGRATVASVKNFQLAQSPCGDEPLPLQPGKLDHDEIILQFGKVGKDMFTMDYRYPLSAFQAFAICLSSFDTKLICE